MGTRCNIHFNDGKRVCANIYRHHDGYPGDVKNGVVNDGGVLADILEFYTELLENVNDHRFSDPTYLAAKFLVWQAKQNARVYDAKTGEYTPAHYLEFLSVGICTEDAGDGEYVYEVDSEQLDAKGCPAVRVKGTNEDARFKTEFLHGKSAKGGAANEPRSDFN